MNYYNVFIMDDKSSHISKIKKIVEELLIRDQQLFKVIETCHIESYNMAKDFILQHINEIDFLFIDIDFTTQNNIDSNRAGVELVKELQESLINKQIIFCTSYPEQAFSVINEKIANNCRYVTKGGSIDNLREETAKVLNNYFNLNYIELRYKTARDGGEVKLMSVLNKENIVAIVKKMPATDLSSFNLTYYRAESESALNFVLSDKRIISHTPNQSNKVGVDDFIGHFKLPNKLFIKINQSTVLNVNYVSDTIKQDQSGNRFVSLNISEVGNFSFAIAQAYVDKLLGMLKNR